MHAILFALVGTGFAGEPVRSWAAEIEHVRIRLNFLPGVEHAFLYLAQQKGWYASEGLDVEVIPGQGSTVAVKTVGSGEDQFAIADTASAARGWEVGIPIVYVAMLLRNTPTAIFSLPAKNIHKMEDLCGKRVGLNVKSAAAEQYRAMVRAADLKCAIEEVPIVSGGTKEVLSGIVDAAVNFSYTDALRVKLAAGDANVILARGFFDILSLGIICNTKLIVEKPDVVRRFVKVSMKALSYALANQDDALSAFLVASPTSDRTFESEKLRMFASLIKKDSSGNIDFRTSPNEWADTMKVLNDIGLVHLKLDSNDRSWSAD